MTLTLRPYQRESLDALYGYWETERGSPLIVLPTGAGKSLVIAKMVEELLAQFPDLRVAIVTHSKELIVQNYRELIGLWPAAPAGIYSASVGRRETHSRILFCGVQSVYNKVDLIGPRDLIIVDECFPAGTIISSPAGGIPIEKIKVGDVVYNAQEQGVVQAVSRRVTRKMIKMDLSDGSTIRCTENHPFFTEKGWIKAGKLAGGTRLFSHKNVRSLRSGVSPIFRIGRKTDARASVEEAALLLNLLLKESGECHVGPWREREDDQDASQNWSPADDQMGQRLRPHKASESSFELAWGGVGSRACGPNDDRERSRVSNLLQDRRSELGSENCDRIGRIIPFGSETGGGQEKGCSSSSVWVERVSVEELGCDEDVFNLQISGHPSYYAGGVLVHNCHLIPRDSGTMYGKFFSNMAEITADMRVCGLTATPYRMDSGLLAEGPGAMFDRIVYEANVGDLIEGEYLSPLISKASAAQIDLNGIGTRAGDFISSDMERAAMADGLVERAVAELVAYGQDRRAWLAFCSGVDHATAVRDAIRAHGITAETVHGAMKQGERNAVIERFRRGEIRCLTSVNVLSIGFNVPHVDLVALMRGTKSTGMYVQQVGRGFRRAPGKENALILDFASVIRMHGPVDAVSVLPKKKGAKGETEKVTVNDVRAKECPDCESLAALNARTCKVCGHEWQIEVKPSHEAEADATTGILSSEKVPPQSIPVLRWDWKRWKKEGSPDSVRITYVAGLNTYSEWVCPEHGGYAGQKAANWWSEHGGDMPPPKDADEAMERRGEATLPATITVRPAKHNPRYFDIVGRSFAAAQGRAA